MRLLQYGNEVKTIFGLLGSEENDMTSALGWALARSDLFVRLLVKDICGYVPTSAEPTIRLQTARGLNGITDVEIEFGEDLVVVIEAKRGTQVPTAQQLEKYAAFLGGSRARERHIVALTNASQASAAINLRCKGIDEKQLHHRSWRQIRQRAREAFRKTPSTTAKLWLRSFCEYIGEILGMETKYSNRVFVVSLNGQLDGWKISFRDIVEKKGRYFFPVGNRWPDPPPNYLGFRYNGRLQSIHHVKKYITFTRPAEIFPEAPRTQKWALHYCLTLGPAIKPLHDVLNGPRIRMSNRVYCLLDTLLTNRTISDALTETERREAATD